MSVIANDVVNRLLSPSTLERLSEFKESFRHATPFRFVVIDDFFESSFADALLAEFPAFDRDGRDEFGRPSRKSVIPALSALGPAYRMADDMIASPSFLEWVGNVTSIESLLHDPDHFGGGTHENLHGQELDPHVDFNRHPKTGAHRRLNLIVYLNRDWRDSWGGSIELHSNPRDPRANTIRRYAPIFNRAIIFETNEHSWHAFPRITLPESERHRSRKSLSVYLYTTEPPETAVASHATFYVQRPVSDVLKVGDVVHPDTLLQIGELLERRDQLIGYYQQREIDYSATLDQVSQRFAQWANSTLVPVTGPVVLQRATQGFEPDGWMLASGAFQCEAVGPVSHLRVDGWVPGSNAEVTVNIRAGGVSTEIVAQRGDLFFGELSLRAVAGERIDVQILMGSTIRPCDDLEGSTDDRDLGCILQRVTFS